MSDLLPAIKVEFLIQLRTHCDNRSYAIYGRTHPCGVCGTELGDSGEPWEIFTPNVTPKREGATE